MGKADPNKLLKKFRLQLQAARRSTQVGDGFSAIKSLGLATEAMAELDVYLRAGGAMPSDWLHIPEVNLNHIWVDPSELLNCCMRELLKLKDDPDKHADGKWIQCSRCGTHIVYKNGIWKWGLPPKENEIDYSKMVPFSKLEEFVYYTDNDDTPVDYRE